LATAQFLPPSTAVKWKAQGHGNWGPTGNWTPVSTPDNGDDVFFGAVPGGALGPEIRITNNASRTLRSVWFDAASDIWYTIRGTGLLHLGGGLGSNEVVIGVASNLQSVTENNIENRIRLDNSIPGRDLWIVNDSLGGLRLANNLVLGSQNLIVSNTGKPLARSAVHFNGAIIGTGDISTVNGSTQHLVLQANNWNSDWSGTLNVGAQTLVFVKRDRALGKGANLVASGGTLGFRSHGHGPLLTYNSPAQAIQVSGTGAVRTWGKPAVGAIYHDGGNNRFFNDITMTGDTWFGARGDQGGLLLGGLISGANYSFTKVGLGLIHPR